MPTNPLELAKQGDPNAIAMLLNRTLQPKGITATAEQQGGFLHVMLHSSQVPPHKQIVEFIQQGMNKLETTVIHTVRIDSYQSGSDQPAWSDEFGLESGLTDTDVFSGVPMIDDPDLDDFQTSGSAIGNDVSYDLPRYEDPHYDEELPQEEYEDGVVAAEPEVVVKQKNQPSKLLLLLLGLLGLLLAGAGIAYALKLGPFAEPALEPVATSPAPPPAKPAAPATPVTTPATATTPAKPITPAKPVAQNKPATPAPVKTPVTPTPAKTPTTPTANTPKPVTAGDPWQEAVKKAEAAGKLAYNQPPETRPEWDALAKEWQTAIDAMKKVPATHPKYQEAQTKVKEYQSNLDYAKQNAGN